MSDTKHNAPSSRACPSCGELRPADAFRSPHPRAHCDVCKAAKGKAPRLSESDARGVLRDFPDADLSAFDVEGDVEAMAADEAKKSIAALEQRADEADPRRDSSRRRRLLRHGVDADRCALLGIELDVGPRAAPYAHPAQVGVFTRGVHYTVWVSRIGAQIVEACLSADELELAAAFLRNVRDGG
jgi:hypothetical protein